jgi:hypothetical protein
MRFVTVGVRDRVLCWGRYMERPNACLFLADKMFRFDGNHTVLLLGDEICADNGFHRLLCDDGRKSKREKE